jgi:hypothetical protein
VYPRVVEHAESRQIEPGELSRCTRSKAVVHEGADVALVARVVEPEGVGELVVQNGLATVPGPRCVFDDDVRMIQKALADVADDVTPGRIVAIGRREGVEGAAAGEGDDDVGVEGRVHEPRPGERAIDAAQDGAKDVPVARPACSADDDADDRLSRPPGDSLLPAHRAGDVQEVGSLGGRRVERCSGMRQRTLVCGDGSRTGGRRDLP